MTLSPAIVDGLEDSNNTEPAKLQQQVIAKILDGNDALINASPGKEKNLSFIIPTLAKIDANQETDETTTLILTPNSDDAHAIEELVRHVGSHMQFDCATIDLDSSEEEQKELLKSNPRILIGNPGPLADIMQSLRYILRYVELVVIDDINKLMSLNLISKVENILKRVLSGHQTLIYADDLTHEIEEYAINTLNDGIAMGFDDERVLSKPPKVTGSLSHGYIYVPSRMKITTLIAHVEESPDDRYVIFTASKRGADRLYKTLHEHDFKVTSLHGKLSDEKYAQRFTNFTSGDVQFLLVADLSAATLNIENVAQVINYDVPNDVDEYRYRASLVADGNAASMVSLVSKQDRSDINKLESELGQAPKELDLPKKVQQKLKERKKKKQKKSSKSKKRSNGNKQNRRREKKKDKDMELPRPSYDKLSGGKGGDHKKDKKSGVINMLKNLFS